MMMKKNKKKKKTEEDSNSKLLTRLGGQPFITSAFRPSNNHNHNPFSNSQGGNAKKKTEIPEKDKKTTLSDFLNQKLLHKSCALPNPLPPLNTKNLIRPFVAHCAEMESNEQNKDPKKGFQTDKFPLEFVLEEFKCTDTHKEDPVNLSFNEEVGSYNMNDMLESRKRKNPPSLITLGDDPKKRSYQNWKQEKREKFIVEKKPRHLFNHYGNGKGWWDGNMEGVDNEEVGSVETWEGVGSATLGGLEWH